MRFGLFKLIREKVDQLVGGRGRVDEDLVDELEELLIQADVNVGTTQAAIAELRAAIQEDRLQDVPSVLQRLKNLLKGVLTQAGASQELQVSPQPPTLYLIVGVNGVGKTTSIAKLTYMLQKQGKRVVLAAGDTFRAAAIDQLELWARRTDTEMVRHREGADPSAVVFDAIKAARARGADYVIADTAGRLHTRSNLMEELRKINRVAEKELGRPPDEVLLVLDATVGQNGISQARQFLKSVPLSGLILAKLDGTARGGIVLSVVDELKLPVKLIGTGEKLGDMELFDPGRFVDGLLD